MAKVDLADKEALEARKAEKSVYGSWGDSVKVTWWRILLYALLSDDFQWIHVNPLKARKGPFGGIVAHGGLIYVLLNKLAGPQLRENFESNGIVDLVRDKVRSPNPVRLGQRLHLRYKIIAIRQTESGAIIDYDIQVGIVGVQEEKDAIALECRAKLAYAA